MVNRRAKGLWGLFFGIWYLFTLSSCEPKEMPTNEGFVNINGSDIYYKIVGEGDPLIIVHGGPVLDHSYFLPHLESLSRDYQLIFYDQRAAGKSSTEVDSAKMNLAAFVEDIDLLRKKLGFEKINLMGHSWGGLLAMAYGIEYSDRLDHLILANSMASNVTDWQAEAAAVGKAMSKEDMTLRQALLDSLRSNPNQRIQLIGEYLKSSFIPQMYDKANIDRLDISLPDDYDLRSRLTQLLGPDISTFNYDSSLSKITCPTLLIYGKKEMAVDIYVNKLQELIPNSELKTIAESGHFPFIEQPKAFRRVVNSFLK